MGKRPDTQYLTSGARPLNTIDMFRYAQPQGSTTEQIARHFAQGATAPGQLTQFADPNQWSAMNPQTRFEWLSYLLNNPSQFGGPGRQHAGSPSIFQGGAAGGAGIPGLTAPSASGGPTGAVPPSVFAQPPSSTDGGTPGTTPGVTDIPPSGGGMNESTDTDAAGLDTGAGGSAGQSFAEGGRAFGPDSPLSIFGTPAGRIGLGILGGIIGIPGVTAPISVPVTVEKGLEFVQRNFPRAATVMGIGTGTVAGGSGGVDAPVGAQAGQEGAASTSPSGIAGGSGGVDTTVGEPGIGGVSVDAGTGEGEGAASAGTGGTPGGSGGADATAGDNTGQEGAASTAAGITGEASVGAISEGAPAPSEGGGGGASTGDGDGCYLATWTLDALHPKDEAHARKFFKQFYDGFVRLQKKDGPRLFSLYQVAARRIIRAASQAGDAKRVQQEIYDKLIKPTGRSVEANEIPGAVKNLITVVKNLAARYKVPLTPEMERASQVFLKGTQPKMFKGAK